MTVLQSSTRKTNFAFAFFSHLRKFFSTLFYIICYSLCMLSRLCAFTGLVLTLFLQGPLASPCVLKTCSYWQIKFLSRALKIPVYIFARNFSQSLVAVWTLMPCRLSWKHFPSPCAAGGSGAAWQIVGVLMTVFCSAVLLLPLHFSWAGLSCRIQARGMGVHVLGALGQGGAHLL